MPTSIDLAQFIETALNAAQKAGEAIMQIYSTDFIVNEKEDNSPVTAADLAAEKIVLQTLRAHYPDIPVIAEEEMAAGTAPDLERHKEGYFILVDPLDGTREFTHRNGAFTVNIALIDKQRPVAGVVHAPALGRTFAGYQDADGRKIAFEMINGNKKTIGIRPADTQKRTAVASVSYRDAATDAFLDKSGITDIVSIGSSLKFCLLASGEADLYPRFGRTMEWDTAAGHAILLAAGGNVTTIDGMPFIYGKRNQNHDSDFANPGFIAFGDTRLIETLTPTR